METPVLCCHLSEKWNLHGEETLESGGSIQGTSMCRDSNHGWTCSQRSTKYQMHMVSKPFHDDIVKIQASEMSQLLKELAAKAWRPEFDPQDPQPTVEGDNQTRTYFIR